MQSLEQRAASAVTRARGVAVTRGPAEECTVEQAYLTVPAYAAILRAKRAAAAACLAVLRRYGESQEATAKLEAALGAAPAGDEAARSART